MREKDVKTEESSGWLIENKVDKEALWMN